MSSTSSRPGLSPNISHPLRPAPVQNAGGAGERRSAMRWHRASRSTHRVGIFNRPGGSSCGGRLRGRAAQPYGPIRFSRPASDSPQDDAGRRGCEIFGLGPQHRRTPPGHSPGRAIRYSTCGRSSSPGGTVTSSKSLSGTWARPRRSMARRDGRLIAEV